MRIEGASALVVGGASGLGEATVRRLHGDGAHVTVADLNAENGKALVADLGDRAAFVACDVTEEDQVQAAVSAAHAAGGLRICVSCAAMVWAERTVSKHGPHRLDAFARVIEINLVGSFNVLRLAAAAMQENEPDDGDRGVIINTSSVAATEGQIGQVAYSASKGGIVAMALPAARDLSRQAIRVNVIAPGIFGTPMLGTLSEEARTSLAASIPHPPRLGRPSEYAALVAHIVENGMINAAVIRLDGALRMGLR